MKPGQRDYNHEYESYHGKPAQIKKRAQRNAARAKMVEKGAVSKGDGKVVDHKTPIRQGGGNADSNLKVTSRSANAGWRKGA
ncbi:MAG TPA: HNH endonuclease signature motif containing protein [Burkholderiales bacterium]|nr:HNH endonuclease signature motif containing protein [Burkholderiales bacterium]